MHYLHKSGEAPVPLPAFFNIQLYQSMYNGRIKPLALQHNQRRGACAGSCACLSRCLRLIFIVLAILQAKQKGGTNVPPLIRLNK